MSLIHNRDCLLFSQKVIPITLIEYNKISLYTSNLAIPIFYVSMTLTRLRHVHTPYEIKANKKRPPKEAVLVCSSSGSIIQRPIGSHSLCTNFSTRTRLITNIKIAAAQVMVSRAVSWDTIRSLTTAVIPM